MTTIRRWYIFLVCAVSLQAVIWALIALLRNLFTTEGDIPMQAVALSLSVIIIGFPLYLAHWLWEQKLAGRDLEDRSSALRHLYLYGMMAGFLLPFVFNAESVLRGIVNLILGYAPMSYQPAHALQIGRALLAILPLGLSWLYHNHQTRVDARFVTLPANAALMRRLYVLILSGTGLLVFTIGSSNLLRWLLMHVGPNPVNGTPTIRAILPDITWLIVSIPLWVIHWAWAQRLFQSFAAEEKASAVRKFYLYIAVFISMIGLVSNLTILLAGLLRRVLGLAAQGDWRSVLPWVIMLGVIWAYHAMQLQRDARQAIELPQQAAIRRLYHYLVAAIGLTAFLIGVGGDISVLIRAIGGDTMDLLKEQLAWFTAALISGLPVWLLPWRSQQSDEAGIDENRSLVRRIYLYLFVFAATMTMLGCAITIVYRLLSTLFGERAVAASELTQAIAFVLIALGVWLYHGYIIVGDGRRLQHAQAEKLAAQPVLVWRDAHGWADELITQARSEINGIAIEFAKPDGELMAQIAASGVLVFPWTIYQPESGSSPELLQAIASSPARKLLLPACPAGWDWVGVERWDAHESAHHTVRALKQILAGEAVRFNRPLSTGAIIASTIVGLILLVIGFVIIMSVLDSLFI